LRKESHKKGEIQKVLSWSDFLSVYIYGIAHGLKGIERNTDGQGYILELEIAIKELIEVLNEEIGILEVAQHSQIRHHT
jgi:hypothetical protein